jgi:hypothetical protein
MLTTASASKLKNKWAEYRSKKFTNEQTYVWYADIIGKRPNGQTLWRYQVAILSLIGTKKSGVTWFVIVQLIEASTIWWKFDSVWINFEII